jgi:hypothetical protein
MAKAGMEKLHAHSEEHLSGGVYDDTPTFVNAQLNQARIYGPTHRHLGNIICPSTIMAGIKMCLLFTSHAITPKNFKLFYSQSIYKFLQNVCVIA